MKLKRIIAGILTLDDGTDVHIERIGSGRFSTAWKNGTAVYVQTHEQDYAKELLGHLRGTPHLPDVERIGEIGIHNWYRMPLYQKLTAAHKRAWQDFKKLKQLRLDASAAEQRRNGQNYREFSPARVNDLFAEMVEGDAGLTTYGDSIRALADWCATYGESWLIEEFQPRNCVVDGDGKLILLDPVFDLAIIQAEQERRMKKHRFI